MTFIVEASVCVVLPVVAFMMVPASPAAPGPPETPRTSLDCVRFDISTTSTSMATLPLEHVDQPHLTFACFVVGANDAGNWLIGLCGTNGSPGWFKLGVSREYADCRAAIASMTSGDTPA